MVDLIALLDSIADAIRSCPEVMGELDGNTNAVLAYTDIATTEANNLKRTVYMAPNGTVLVAWMSSDISEGTMEGWEHSIDIYVRAMRQRSPLRLLNAVIDGTPEGTGLRWRYQCVHDSVLPMNVSTITRDVDEEEIDTYVIRASFREKGDEAYALSS